MVSNPRVSEQHVLHHSYVTEVDMLGTIDGFLAYAVNRKIVVAYPSATTETYSFQAGSTVLMVYTVTYTDSTKASLSSVERTT